VEGGREGGKEGGEVGRKRKSSSTKEGKGKERRRGEQRSVEKEKAGEGGPKEDGVIVIDNLDVARGKGVEEEEVGEEKEEGEEMEREVVLLLPYGCSGVLTRPEVEEEEETEEEGEEGVKEGEDEQMQQQHLFQLEKKRRRGDPVISTQDEEAGEGGREGEQVLGGGRVLYNFDEIFPLPEDNGVCAKSSSLHGMWVWNL
jgi:hypothetical protein